MGRRTTYLLKALFLTVDSTPFRDALPPPVARQGGGIQEEAQPPGFRRVEVRAVGSACSQGAEPAAMYRQFLRCRASFLEPPP